MLMQLKPVLLLAVETPGCVLAVRTLTQIAIADAHSVSARVSGRAAMSGPTRRFWNKQYLKAMVAIGIYDFLIMEMRS